MKPLILIGTALALLVSPLSSALAQSPEEQAAQAQAMQQMPFMSGMQELQAKYQKIKEERAQERKAITDAIYAEELARAKQQQAGDAFPDPYAASEWAAKQRLEPLAAQWKQEDQELEQQMHEEMMNSTGMGDLMKMQQEAMKNYGYPDPPPQQ
jgi:hypothetical protein